MEEASATSIPPQVNFDFTATDIVKLHAATFLPLCSALDVAGIISKGEVAKLITAYVPEGDQSPWAQVVMALSVVLAKDEEPGQSPGREQDRERMSDALAPFSVILGGRSD